MHTPLKWLRRSAAALFVATCMAAAPAHAEGEDSTENQARMGFPPGVSSPSTTMTAEGRLSIPPGDEARSAEGTIATDARLTLPPGSSTAARSSSWQVFVTWLRAQALHIASQ